MTDRVFYPAQEQTLKKAIHALRQIKELLGGGGAVPDGAVTTSKLADNAVTMGKLSQDVQDAIEEGGSGYNPSLSVGRADALTGADETAQWSQRTTEGSGSATVRSVQGAAVGWNQLTEPSKFANNASALSTVENVTTVTSTNQNGYFFGVRLRTTADMISGHKYLVAYDVDRSGCVDTDFKGIDVSGFTPSMSALNSGHYWRIGTSTGSNVYVNAVYLNTNPHDLTCEYFTLANVMLIDLTAMFGSGNEPTTVAEFEAMYPEPYYPYSAPTLKPVQIAGVASKDAQGNELDAIEWDAFTLRGAGSVADMLYADHVDVNVGVVDLGDFTWTYADGRFGTNSIISDATDAAGRSEIACAPYAYAPSGTADKTAFMAGQRVYVYDSAYTDATAFKAAMNGVILFYILATPTTTPISPALPMTYKVQAGGSESIIVPDGEVSAAPVLTIAEGESAAELVMDALACIATPDGPTATANHSVGTYLTMGGKLYKVTSAIAVGETITPNTNVTETTVMAELIARTA